MSNYEEISRQAEADLNTYQAKTGAARPSANNDAGVDTNVEKKFESANVAYGDDLSTNRGYNKRIPPGEGGDLDARGRLVSLFPCLSNYSQILTASQTS